MDTNLLSRLITAKHSVIVELQAIVHQQVAAGNDPSMAHLNAAMHRKDALVDELLSLESQLDAFRTQDPEARVWESPEARQQCRQTEAECRRMLDEILAHERQAEATLIQRRNDTSHQLQQSSAARQARNAYRNAEQPRGTGFNMSSG